jgi:hypothetical protein
MEQWISVEASYLSPVSRIAIIKVAATAVHERCLSISSLRLRHRDDVQ